MPQDTNHVYSITELVGTSHDGIEAAINNALARANQTIRNLDWFEVREVRGNITDGAVGWYQVKVGVGFRVDAGQSSLTGQ